VGVIENGPEGNGNFPGIANPVRRKSINSSRFLAGHERGCRVDRYADHYSSVQMMGELGEIPRVDIIASFTSNGFDYFHVRNRSTQERIQRTWLFSFSSTKPSGQ
jgi:hypothetical protein